MKIFTAIQKEMLFPSPGDVETVDGFCSLFAGESSCCMYLSVPAHLEGFLLWREQSRPLCKIKAT